MSLKTSILSVLSYFDLLDYPLTIHELQRWLWGEKCQMVDIVDGLERDPHLQKVIATEDGVYFFRGREDIVRLRRGRERMSMRKWRRIRFVVFLLRHILFLRGIFLTNRLAYENADEESDIDLFCIAERGHLWTVRFFAAGLMKILNLRPKPERTRNGICLSFYVTNDHLDLRPFLLAPLHEEETLIPDIQFIYWLSQFYPLYSEGKTKEQFWVENRWIETHLPNVHFSDTVSPSPASVIKRSLENLLTLIGPMVERGARALQLAILPEALRSMVNKDTRVVMNNHVLKLHTNDHRDEYRKRWAANLKHYHAS